jgi:hypothetical protein
MRLVVLSGGQPSRTYSFSQSAIRIGRSPGNDLKIESDKLISGMHAVFKEGNGWWLQDLNSTNGTVVGGALVRGGPPIPVFEGMQITLGQTTLRVEDCQTNPSQRAAVASNQCSQCRNSFSAFGIRSRGKSVSSLCRECEQSFLTKCNQLESTVATKIGSHALRSDELMLVLRSTAQQLRLDLLQVLSLRPQLAKSILDRYWVFLLVDGLLSENEETDFLRLLEQLDTRRQFQASFQQQIELATAIRDIRSGKMPQVKGHYALPTTEILHFQAPATHVRHTQTKIQYVPGTLLVTNARIAFVDSLHPFESSLSKLLGVNIRANDAIELSLTKRQGNGILHIPNAPLAYEIIRGATRHFNRQADLSNADSRSIPQHVKAAVWQRDQGRCVQCGGQQYLEFDHIIAYSLGGATSEQNLQLLCRGCNARKGTKL